MSELLNELSDQDGLLVIVAVVAVGVLFCALRAARAGYLWPGVAIQTAFAASAPSISGARSRHISDFWALFEGDGDQAELLRNGGRLYTRRGQQITIFRSHTQLELVIVVAASRRASSVRRYVCCPYGGLFSKEEPRIGGFRHIADLQAQAFSKEGMNQVSVVGVVALTALLGTCRNALQLVAS